MLNLTTSLPLLGELQQPRQRALVSCSDLKCYKMLNLEAVTVSFMEQSPNEWSYVDHCNNIAL